MREACKNACTPTATCICPTLPSLPSFPLPCSRSPQPYLHSSHPCYRMHTASALALASLGLQSVPVPPPSSPLCSCSLLNLPTRGACIAVRSLARVSFSNRAKVLVVLLLQTPCRPGQDEDGLGLFADRRLICYLLAHTAS